MYMYVLCVCVCVCVCVFVCCVCACVWSTVYVCICVFLIFNSPSIIKLHLSSKKSYVSVENMCMHLCACYRSSDYAESEGIWLCP